MSDTVVKVENLSKSYTLGHQRQEKYLALRDVIANKAKKVGKRLTHPFKGSAGGLVTADETEEFWALKEISFEIKRGDRLGIIGRNGAGKSTLLKILSRITEPTRGRIGINGRVASLLEVGTGFHPELTGRENIFLNGAILGMSRADIKLKFSEIVAFAEVEKFLDTPVKRYSSGMYVRLAFAVAAHLEPEILIVDEVLAVGDMNFQKKCLGKMEEVSKAGRTLLFVSHNMGAVVNLCEKSLLLEAGKVFFNGETSSAVNKYLRRIENSGNPYVSFEENKELKIGINSIRIFSKKTSDKLSFDFNEDIFIEITYDVIMELSGSNIAIQISSNGVIIFNSFDIDFEKKLFEKRPAGKYVAKIVVPKRILKAGIYSLNVSAGQFSGGIHDRKDSVMTFEVLESSVDTTFAGYAQKRPGLIVPPLSWNTEYLG